MSRRKIRKRERSSHFRYSRPCASSPRRCASGPKVPRNGTFGFPFRYPAMKPGESAATNLMEVVSRGVFGLASAVLMLIALALSVYAAGLIVSGLMGPWAEAGTGLLESIGYVVIAVAVF